MGSARTGQGRWNRTRRGLWMAGLFWFLATGLVAQTVPVQSGEHPGYSRLALFIGGAGWRLGRSADGYTLAVDAAAGFDIDGVFDLIPRTRIAALQSDGEQLRIDIACDCHAIAYPWRGNWLVLDVRDGTPPDGSPFETTFDPAQGATARGATAIPLFVASAPAQLPLPDTFFTSPPPSLRVDEVRRQMAEGLAQAAAQGLLDLAMPAPAIADPVRSPGPDPSEPPAASTGGTTPLPSVVTPAATADPTTPGTPGIVARTSMDRALSELAAGDSAAAGHCLPDSDFDLAAWAGTGDFGAEMAIRWAALTTETGAIPAGAPEDLARSQLAFGFGLEAYQTLGLDDRKSQERDRLRLLAKLIEGEPIRSDALADQTGCVGAVALWAALGRGGLEGTTEAERIAVTVAFRRLPPAIQGLVGPRLTGYFIHIGDQAGAGLLLDRIEATDAGGETAAGLAAAQLETASGAPDAALQELQTLADQDARLGPDGVIALVDLAIDRNALPDDSLVDLVRSLRFEYRGRPEDAALGLAEARLLTATGQYTDARQTAVALPPATRDAALTTLLDSAASDADDPVFLDIAFSEMPGNPEAGAIHAVAVRLIDLGFPEQALALLAAPVIGPEMAERRHLRAAAAAALGRPDLVEAELLGIDDPRARELRESLRTGGASDQTAAAWRTGNWTTLETQPDALLQAAAQAMLTPPSDLAAGTPLASRSALIADAEETRRLARELLDRYSVPLPAPRTE